MMFILKMSDFPDEIVSGKMAAVPREVAFDLLALVQKDPWLKESVLSLDKVVTQVGFRGSSYQLLDEHNPDEDGLYDAIDIETGDIIKIDFA